jgi:uncharacterized protein (TIGR02421 family)
MLSARAIDRLAVVDAAIVDSASRIKVLSRLSWPAGIQQGFLDNWQRGRPRLPTPTYAPAGLEATAGQLEACMARLHPADDPLSEYLYATAWSYHRLCLLLEAAGTTGITEHSRALYGAPGDLISTGHVDNLAAARHFLEVSTEYRGTVGMQEADYCLPAELLAHEMSERLAEVFPPGTVRVEIDPDMASKAAAGFSRIRLRGGACFSEYDLEQLLQHEAFVHSLTAVNGMRQSRFRTLGLGAPRTTETQEGLATFAELVTGVIDINRLERLALRVIGIDHALMGADFVDVFRFFLEAGQGELESFNSTMRIFRGAPVTGGAAFTKDVVYLHGLMEIHTFFRWAMQHQKLGMCRHLFAGRMTIGDAVRLEPLFESGVLDEPEYLPPWMVRTNGLAGYLAFAVFANRITIEELDEYHEFDKAADLAS